MKLKNNIYIYIYVYTYIYIYIYVMDVLYLLDTPVCWPMIWLRVEEFRIVFQKSIIICSSCKFELFISECSVKHFSWDITVNIRQWRYQDRKLYLSWINFWKMKIIVTMSFDFFPSYSKAGRFLFHPHCSVSFN